MSTYQPRIKSQTNILVEQLRTRAGQPMDVSKWAMFYSFDVMGDVGFGKPFTNMATGHEHSAIHAMHKHVWLLGVITAIPWFPLLVSAIPGASVGLAEFFDICAKALEEKQRVSNAVRTSPCHWC